MDKEYQVRVRIEIVGPGGDTVNHKGYYDSEKPWRADIVFPGSGLLEAG